MSKEMREYIDRVRNWKQSLNEDIDASEAYNNNDAVKTVLSGKRNVGLVKLSLNQVEELKKSGLNVIFLFPEGSEIRREYYKELSSSGWGESGAKYYVDNSYIIYNNKGKDDAFKLYEYMKSHGGFVSDDTPDEARYIGKLLGYNDESINQYINKKYIT